MIEIKFETDSLHECPIWWSNFIREFKKEYGYIDGVSRDDKENYINYRIALNNELGRYNGEFVNEYHETYPSSVRFKTDDDLTFFILKFS
jgi:hypothetical protein